jgi:ribosome modulation factor
MRDTRQSKTPYEQGFEAYAVGRSREDNPYEWDTVEEWEWNRGWQAHINKEANEHPY